MLWGDWRVCVIETPRSSLDKRSFFENLPSIVFTPPSVPPLAGGQKPSLPLRKAPPFSPSLSSIVFTPPSVPTVLGDRNPQGREDVTALRAQNRYAIRLADHQRSTPDCAGWDRLGWSGDRLAGTALLKVGGCYTALVKVGCSSVHRKN